MYLYINSILAYWNEKEMGLSVRYGIPSHGRAGREDRDPYTLVGKITNKS